jgi:AraC-like DNA-binding protein
MRCSGEIYGSFDASTALRRGDKMAADAVNALEEMQFFVRKRRSDVTSPPALGDGRFNRLQAKEGRGERWLRLSGESQIVTIALRCAKGRQVEGMGGSYPVLISAGSYYLCSPGLDVRLEVAPPYDFLQLAIPSLDPIVATDQFSGFQSGSQPRWPRNAFIDEMGKFLASEDSVGSVQNSYSMASELIAIRLRRARNGKAGYLQAWRLKHVQNYIETKMDSRINLRDLASEARLSPMHFAAQFKAATGLKPHEYVLFRRIERAKTIIASSNKPLVEIALETGFQSQSHFTGIFKRFTGETPGSWRKNTVG